MGPNSDSGGRTPFGTELIEILNELRVILPGVQLLFAFMLTVPFSERFRQMPDTERLLFFVDFLCTTFASLFLIAPAVYHRLHWRRDVRDKEEMLRTFNRLALLGGFFLALAMLLTVFLLTHYLYGIVLSVVTTATVFLFLFWLWYGLPLLRRQKAARN